MGVARASCRIAGEAWQEGRRGEIARIGRHSLDRRRDHQGAKADRSKGAPIKHDCSRPGERTASLTMAQRTSDIFGKLGPEHHGFFPQKT
jgi:hypothetical protein